MPDRHGREGRRAPGPPTIRIQGVDKPDGASHAVVADRIEAGTYAMAAAMAGGEVRLTGRARGFMGALLPRWRRPA